MRPPLAYLRRGGCWNGSRCKGWCSCWSWCGSGCFGAALLLLLGCKAPEERDATTAIVATAYGATLTAAELTATMPTGLAAEDSAVRVADNACANRDVRGEEAPPGEGERARHRRAVGECPRDLGSGGR